MQADQVPVRSEELEAAFPPPSQTLNLSGVKVIGLVIEAVGRAMTLGEVHDQVQSWGIGLDEAALRRCAERPNAILLRVDEDRWAVDAESEGMAAARRRLRKLADLNAKKLARERRFAAERERYQAEHAERIEAERRLEEKLPWSGRLLSVQPRIRLTRSFDERQHSYLGYVLRVAGTLGDGEDEFTVGIGKAAQAKHAFRAGDDVAGMSLRVSDQRTEPVEYYKTSKLRLMARGPEVKHAPPPWRGAPPDLMVYRERGHRRLDPRVYEKRCSGCIWGCRMPVVMIVDHWNPSRKRYRFETFCYGPKSCRLYRSGKARVVPGRNGMSWVEEDWVDEEETAHRGPEA